MYFYDGEGTGSIFDGTKILREYITDEEMFEKLIDKYEENMENDPDTPLFIMGITMQNHGGYKDTYDNFTNTVHYQGGYYPDADQYLSCIHATDSAVETDNMRAFIRTWFVNSIKGCFCKARHPNSTPCDRLITQTK